MPSKKKEKLVHKLRLKYRLVIFDDETYEEKFSFKLSAYNVFFFLTSLSVLLIFITTYIIAFTSLREYIPGYSNVGFNKRVYQMQRTTDSLEDVLRQNELYFENIKRIVDGTGDFSSETRLGGDNEVKNIQTDTIHLRKSAEDSLLRLEFESAERYNLQVESSLTPESRKKAMAVTGFFVPLKGMITSDFDSKKRHYGVDIVAGSNEAIKATLAGTVVYADWSLEKGYVIGVQHAGNFFSLYKHNSALLKKEGDLVKAGEPIAIIGQTGELSTGPHLHFELWFNGSPINPKDYISF
ncbi:MAG: M23 family metallopeptidase [Bacteroidales bacterium]|jgi:murein DD-endopeptidase MepM/ murein hydrolase activator NlpD